MHDFITVFPVQHLQTAAFKVNFKMRLVEGCEIIRNLPMSEQRGAQTKTTATMQKCSACVHDT